MQIERYSGKYDEEIRELILTIQNKEAKIDLSLAEQPDLLAIGESYQKSGGQFFLATENGKVIGTVGLMLKEKNCAVLKKFFIKKEFRSKRVGLELYRELLQYAKKAGVRHIILDTPSVAQTSHRFYEKAGFHKIIAAELPVPYTYPDRDSILYELNLEGICKGNLLCKFILFPFQKLLVNDERIW